MWNDKFMGGDYFYELNTRVEDVILLSLYSQANQCQVYSVGAFKVAKGSFGLLGRCLRGLQNGPAFDIMS